MKKNAPSAARRLPALGHPESTSKNLPDSDRAEIDRRLARIEGHVAAIRRMLDKGEDCDALLIQTSAVRSALNGVLVGLMEKHLACCVLPDARAGNEGKAADRFRRALETVLKRS
jgi:CsoR family transcriptional regulator, copper-sensing transcriptional repressor